jgi:hypothetical protein
MFMVSVQDQLVHGHWTVVRQSTVAAREHGRAKLLTSWKPGRGEKEEGRRERERERDRQTDRNIPFKGHHQQPTSSN